MYRFLMFWQDTSFGRLSLAQMLLASNHFLTVLSDCLRRSELQCTARPNGLEDMAQQLPALSSIRASSTGPSLENSPLSLHCDLPRDTMVSYLAIPLVISLINDIGPCLNPFGALLLLQGLETLSLHAERRS